MNFLENGPSSTGFRRTFLVSFASESLLDGLDVGNIDIDG